MNSSIYIFLMASLFICSTLSQQSRQLCSTIAETRFSYSRLFSWYSWAAWLLAGLLGLGSSNRDYREKKNISSLMQQDKEIVENSYFINDSTAVPNNS